MAPMVLAVTGLEPQTEPNPAQAHTVAIASAPSNGTHESGTQALTTIARWLVSHADVKHVPASPSC